MLAMLPICNLDCVQVAQANIFVAEKSPSSGKSSLIAGACTHGLRFEARSRLGEACDTPIDRLMPRAF